MEMQEEIYKLFFESVPVLKYGSSGKPVVLLQKFLQYYGYYDGTIDGDFGNMTFNAVKSYQGVNGLLKDGIVAAITWESIYDDLMR